MFKSLLKSSNSCRGMTLVELILVMAILSVVMMAVMSLYVPTHQSSVAQTQVADVQQNLRLAVNTMTRDLMTAGFLASRYPIVFPDANGGNFGADTLTDIGTENATEFIIRTRKVGPGFARIATATASSLTVMDPDMLADFKPGDTARVFGPMNGEELTPGLILTLGAPTGSVLDFTASPIISAPGDSWKEAVLVKTRDVGHVLQTIHYRLNSEKGLERVVNGVPQILARNLGAVNFSYNYSNGRVNLVNIRLTGETEALKNDAISDAKTREVVSSVRLRNVF